MMGDSPPEHHAGTPTGLPAPFDLAAVKQALQTADSLSRAKPLFEWLTRLEQDPNAPPPPDFAASPDDPEAQRALGDLKEGFYRHLSELGDRLGGLPFGEFAKMLFDAMAAASPLIEMAKPLAAALVLLDTERPDIPPARTVLAITFTLRGIAAIVAPWSPEVRVALRRRSGIDAELISRSLHRLQKSVELTRGAIAASRSALRFATPEPISYRGVVGANWHEVAAKVGKDYLRQVWAAVNSDQNPALSLFDPLEIPSEARIDERWPGPQSESSDVDVDFREEVEWLSANLLAEEARCANMWEASHGAPILADDAWLSPAELQKQFRSLTVNAIGKQLERWREKNDDGWREVSERRPREAKYLYRWGAVRNLFAASNDPARERRAK